VSKRLIEEWLPIAEIGEESMRERGLMTASAHPQLRPRLVGLGIWARSRATAATLAKWMSMSLTPSTLMP